MVRAVAVAAVAFMVSFALEARTASVPARYLVCEIDRDDNITIRSAQDVMLFDVRGGEPRGAGQNRVDVELFDRERSVFRTAVDVDRFLRAEFAGPDGRIEGRWIEKERAAFVVRIPRSGDALELTPRATRRTARIAIDELPPASETSGLILRTESAASDNRLDILVLGDGYTAAEAGKFSTDAAKLTNDFFSIEPYKAYRNFVNVTHHFVASPQSGADHPNCPDATADPASCAIPNPTPDGTFVDTAFDAQYCEQDTRRLLVVDDAKVLTAAGSGWDRIIVIVNDPMYGGSGGEVSVVSANTCAAPLVQHEFGHSFTKLADEYENQQQASACSDISGAPPCEPNVTDVTTRASIKWNSWIDPATPVPTTPQTSYTTVPGLFEGARYHSSGFYRPKYDCVMRHGIAFCEICAQAYVLRLYDGWGSGAPSSGIDPIEPGMESPAPGAISGTAGVMQTFTATILEPVGGPSAEKKWLVDGEEQASATDTLQWTPSSGGTHTVELRVKDLTPLVHSAMAGTSLSSTRTWTVDVVLAAPASFIATASTTPAGTASVALSWEPVPGASLYEIVRRTLSVDQLPQFTSANSTTFTEGSEGAFLVTTDGFPTAVITTNGTLPWGVTLVNQGNGTALLSGTPPPETAGLYPQVLWATNSLGTGMQHFMLTVNASSAVTRPASGQARIIPHDDGGFSTIATTSGTTFLDTPVSPNTAYLYKVRAIGGAYSAQDLATAFAFADEPLTAGFVMTAVHLIQLRAAIDLVRTLAGLDTAAYTHTPVAGGIVRAIDLAEARTAINAARTALGLTTVSFTNPSLDGTRIRAVHVTELRDAVR